MIYGVISGNAHQLKPGNYIISAGSSTPQIIRTLSNGPVDDVKITFPEGVTVRDIDNMLADAGILPPNAINNFSISKLASEYEFLNEVPSLEGFLFPDTYRFFRHSETEVVIRKFLDNFKEKAWPILKSSNQSKILILTTASLLEKEVIKYTDKQTVAGILYKRAKIGMSLQIDATLSYAKCEGEFITCEDPRVLRSDLEVDSLYNTYKYSGFPPGPIGNPGEDSIRAALNPAPSPYFYYLSDPKTKQTIFSKTLDEHNDNRVKYLTK